MTDENTSTKTISCIIPQKFTLDLIINELIEKAVARHDISIQGNAKSLKKKYREAFVDPTLIQHSKNSPKRDPFLPDDFWFVIGFSFALPVVIFVIIGVFLIGDLNTPSDNILYGVLGLIVGSLIGWKISKKVKNKHFKDIVKQEAKGGFVLWVTAHTPSQEEMIFDLFNAYRATNIEVTKN